MTTTPTISWNDLFMRGSIVDLHASIWTARVGIAAQDLGIMPSPEVDQVLALGSHKLIQREAFVDINAAHRRAQRAVQTHSLPFGFVTGARYVPAKMMDRLSDRLLKHRTEFDEAVTAFLDDYAELKAKNLPVVEKALKDAARTPEAAAEALTRLRGEYPTAEALRARFGLRWNVYAIQGPKVEGAAAALETEGQTVRSAISDMVGALRTEVTEKLADVFRLVEKGGGVLQQRTIDSAIDVVDRVSIMNVLGDTVLTDQLARLRELLRRLQAGEKVDPIQRKGLVDVQAALAGDLAAAAAQAEAAIMGYSDGRLLEAA